jgi:GAG-pre-integrase domain
MSEVDNQYQSNSDTSEYLRWHYKLNHISASKILQLVKCGLLPTRLSKCQIPACPSCLFGKATKRSWRHKPRKEAQPSKIRKAISLGECGSIDQLESSTPGLIAQTKGWLTTKRYRVATVFVDHFSDLSYIYLQQTKSSEETKEAKISFERYANQSGVKICRYQADNGRFADKLFREHIQQSGQALTFCGVNAHFQNAVAERRIRKLQDHARTMIIHAQARWHQAVSANLWPYAIRLANEIHT